MSKFKTSIGGQAVMEGITMKGPKLTCLATRMPDGSIKTEITDTKQNPAAKVPIVRGVTAMVIALSEGYKHLMASADNAFPDMEEDKFDQWLKKHFGDKVSNVVGMLAAVIAGFLAIGMFVLLPTFLTGLLDKLIPLGVFKTLVEGLLKVIIFLLYLVGISRMKEIKRVFSYHGAEHKTIFCYESGEALTVENVKKHGRFHPRCGTSFMFITVLISILVFSFVPWTNTWVRMLYKLICLPLVMGLSFESIRYAGKHDNLLSRILAAPGVLVQRLTVFEPDDGMIEVAIAAMSAVIPENGEDAQ
ncbi:MAG: DUF1385 domain-containing protein [Oscillospiraceae bacterium]|nr:DUF1385 domain-containing protein [Oscillospiraceae bacterium]